MKKIGIISLVALIMFGLQLTAQQQPPIITKQNLTLTSDLMTPEVLWAFGRVSDPQVSPDGTKVIYGVSYYSIEQNKGNRELYIVEVAGGTPIRLTESAKSEFNAIWRPDGKKIGYLTSESGSVQLWEMNPDGSGKIQVSNIESGITGFKYAPDQSKIVFSKEVIIENKFKSLYTDLPLASGRVLDDLMYRHWDEWVDTYSHVFIGDYNGQSVSNIIDIMEGQPYQAPLKPFGGIEQVNWTSDSKAVAYTCQKLVGKAASLSTNSDIYSYNLMTKETTNLTKGMMGFDVTPVFSPDGNYMAWESMERDGYESDKNRLYLLNLKTGVKTYATEKFDQNAGDLTWTPDSKDIYFTSDWHGAYQIYQYNLNKGTISQLTKGLQDYHSISLAGKQLITTKQTMAFPAELFTVNFKTGDAVQLTFTNQELMSQLAMGRTEERWIKTHDGLDMQVFVIYPPHFDPKKTYPALLYCKGGPQGPLSQSFHYRWNYQIMAANGYIIVAPARRGVSGFGQAWQEQISGDYHGKSMQDYLTSIDVMSKEPFVDSERLGAIGASAGGYAVYYLAGNHDGRFKAFVAHDGIFNEEAQYLETEEMWFENWDKGGPFWDKNNKVAQEVYKHSPHKYVDKWDTPILVIHGEKDYRVVFTQGMTAFNAAVLKNVPAEFLYFPDENHWVLQPQNAILWQRTFFQWLDKWLK